MDQFLYPVSYPENFNQHAIIPSLNASAGALAVFQVMLSILAVLPITCALAPSTKASELVGQDQSNSAIVPLLHQAIGQPTGKSTGDDSIESFFQIPRTTAGPRPTTVLSTDQVDQRYAKVEAGSAKNNSPALSGAGRFLWHVLDNAGVPMVFGKHSDLDPLIDPGTLDSLSLGQLEKSKTKWSTDSRRDDVQSFVGSESAIPLNNGGSTHKIPQSELEGVDLPVLRDEQSTTP
jgi:hypothetical protein